jgi:phenylacetate-CoA ligase
VPYYRKLFDISGFKPEMFRSLEDISRIPFLTKQIVRENQEDLISEKISEKYIKIVQTGGTTGMPLKFVLDKRYATLTEMIFLSHMWKSIGYRQRDKCVVLREDKVEKIIEGRKYWKRNLLTNWLIMSAFHMNSDTFSIYYKKYNHTNPGLY